MDYFFHILIISGIYSILAISLNIVVGYTGLLSLGHAAFYGIGAYTSAILTTQLGIPFWIGIIAAAILASIAGLFLGIPTLRIRGDYLFIATLGFCEIVRSILNNWDSVTGGAIGVINIPFAQIGFIKFDTSSKFLFLTVFFLLITIFFTKRLSVSPFGRILRAIREDEVATLSFGKNVTRYKVLSLIVGAIFAGIAGSLFAHFNSYIDPSSFSVSESILIFSMMVLGGMGSVWGSILGAFTLVALPEGLRLIGLPQTIAAPSRQLFYGILLILMMLFRPKGIMGEVGVK